MDQKIGHRDRTLRFAFIQSGWHADIVGQCRKGFMEELSDGTHDSASVDLYDVPGAFELPLLAKRLACLKTYDAIVGRRSSSMAASIATNSLHPRSCPA